jgi:serine acetyltransferase
MLYPLIRIYSGLELSPRTQIGPGLYVAHFGPTVIHPEMIAGSHLTIMQGVTSGARKDGIPHLSNHMSISAGHRCLEGLSLATMYL